MVFISQHSGYGEEGMGYGEEGKERVAVIQLL